MFYACYRVFLSGFSDQGNEGRMMAVNRVMVAEGFPGAPRAKAATDDSREALFHSSFEITSISPQLETQVPMWLLPPGKTWSYSCEGQSKPQQLCASWGGFLVLHAGTGELCYLSVSAFDVIRALPARLGVEPGTRCAAWKTQEPSHHLLAAGRLCASQSLALPAARAEAQEPRVTWARQPEPPGLLALDCVSTHCFSVTDRGYRGIMSTVLEGEVMKGSHLNAGEPLSSEHPTCYRLARASWPQMSCASDV